MPEVLENAKGKCEACRSDAPFLLNDGYPFLEVHHMIPLAQGGPDTIENTIALCPIAIDDAICQKTGNFFIRRSING